MISRLAIVCASLVLVACGSPHRFDISSDKPIQNVEINLANVKRSEWRLHGQHRAVVEIRSADSSGEIKVIVEGTQAVACHIGYITGGDEDPHLLTIRDGKCQVEL